MIFDYNPRGESPVTSVLAAVGYDHAPWTTVLTAVAPFEQLYDDTQPFCSSPMRLPMNVCGVGLVMFAFFDAPLQSVIEFDRFSMPAGPSDARSSSPNYDSDGNYRLLSSLRVDLLRRYATSFGPLPQDVKSDKARLIRWILACAPKDLIEQLLAAGLTRKRLRDDKDEDRASKRTPIHICTTS